MTYLGTSDMVSVLPRSFPETNSEGLSVVPTPGRYYRAPGKNSLVMAYRKYRPVVGTTDKSWFFQKRKANVYVLTLNSSHSLGSSSRALLASLGYQFASPYIVRCFLYSNSKSKRIKHWFKMKTLTWSWGASFGQNHDFYSLKSCTHLDQALYTTNCVCHYHQNN
jgi:hypothetical protein